MSLQAVIQLEGREFEQVFTQAQQLENEGWRLDRLDYTKQGEDDYIIIVMVKNEQ